MERTDQTETTESTVSTDAVEHADTSAPEGAVTAESLIEEVSIDGMCGVY
ncbi:mycofactocin precursor MftA [Demetria terragena]|nr:mycofactocin precursor MftA [Demetria terragena]